MNENILQRIPKYGAFSPILLLIYWAARPNICYNIRGAAPYIKHLYWAAGPV